MIIATAGETWMRGPVENQGNTSKHCKSVHYAGTYHIIRDGKELSAPNRLGCVDAATMTF